MKKHLIPNKVMAVVLIFLGILTVFIEGDGTILILTLLMGIPLFFARRNWTSL